jgi:hypothetical protein
MRDDPTDVVQISSRVLRIFGVRASTLGRSAYDPYMLNRLSDCRSDDTAAIIEAMTA